MEQQPLAVAELRPFPRLRSSLPFPSILPGRFSLSPSEQRSNLDAPGSGGEPTLSYLRPPPTEGREQVFLPLLSRRYTVVVGVHGPAQRARGV